MSANAATIQIQSPQWFTAGAVLKVNAYGFLLMTPVVCSILAASVVPLGALTLVIPLVVLAGAVFFQPFGQGNTHITRLVRALNPAAARREDGYVVQLKLSPRLQTGVRATLEDADDIGWLSLGDSGLVFGGDSVKLFVPYDQIERVQHRNIGLRGAFVYGRRIRLTVKGLPEVSTFEVAERSSLLLSESRRLTRQLYERLAAKVPAATK
jgi:hypothetical protein